VEDWEISKRLQVKKKQPSAAKKRRDFGAMLSEEDEVLKKFE
jgi:hypothetical protein